MPSIKPHQVSRMATPNWRKGIVKVRACGIFGADDGFSIEQLEHFAKKFVNCFLPIAVRDRDSIEDPENVDCEESDTEVKNLYAGKWMDAVEEHKDELKHCSFDEERAEECARECMGGLAVCARCQEKKRTLQRLHVYWALITPSMIPEIIDTLGASSTRFMRCLSVQITPKMIQTYPMFNRLAMRRLQYSGRGLKFRAGEWDDVTMTETEKKAGLPAVRGIIKPGPSPRAVSKHPLLTREEEEDRQEDLLWEELAPKNPKKAIWEFTPPQKVEVNFQWCGIGHFLTDDDSDLAIVGALSAQALEAGVFSPVVSQVVLEQTWRQCEVFYFIDQFLHFTAILALLIMVWRQKDGHSSVLEVHQSWLFSHLKSLPTWIELAVIMTVNYWCLLMHSGVELTMAYIEFAPVRARAPHDPRTWFGPYLTLWTICMIIIEVTVCVSITNVCADYMHTPSGQNFLETRPVGFAIIVSLKWFQFLIGMIATEFFGTTVLPAVYAMKCKESLHFLIYMSMALLCMTHAYYSFPLGPDDYEADPLQPLGMFFISFLRMFRLCILGDFDLWELEGIDPVFNFTERSEGSGNVALDEPTSDYLGDGEKAAIHNHMRALFMVVVLVTAVMMMNMYIGVLGKEYERFHDRKVEMFAHQKAKVAVRYILRRRFWVGVQRLLCPCCRPGGEESQDSDSDDNEESGTISSGTLWHKLHRRQHNLLKEGALEEEGAVLKTKGFWMVIPPESVTGDSLEDRVRDICDRQREMHTDVHLLKTLVKEVLAAHKRRSGR